VVGFIINAGAGGAGTNVGPMLISPAAGAVSKCVVVVKTSDPSINFVFLINKNGLPVFSGLPTILAGAAPGSSFTFSGLTVEPLLIAQGDVFSMDIATGSAIWALTAQLES
jgi:hypothetical protein